MTLNQNLMFQAFQKDYLLKIKVKEFLSTYKIVVN